MELGTFIATYKNEEAFIILVGKSTPDAKLLHLNGVLEFPRTG